MRRSARSLIALGALGAALAGLPFAPAMAREAAAPAFRSAHTAATARAFPGERYSQYYYRRRGYGGGAVAAGVLGGLALGTVAGAAIAAPAYGYYGGPGYYGDPGYYPGPGAPVGYYGGGPGQPVGNVYGHDPNWVQYCASKYRSFDPASGTYLARDGNRYVCQ